MQNLGTILGAWDLRNGSTVNVVEDETGQRRICVTAGADGKVQLLMARAVTVAEAVLLAEHQLCDRRTPVPVTEAATITAATVLVMAMPDGRALLEGIAA